MHADRAAQPAGAHGQPAIRDRGAAGEARIVAGQRQRARAELVELSAAKDAPAQGKDVAGRGDVEPAAVDAHQDGAVRGPVAVAGHAQDAAVQGQRAPGLAKRAVGGDRDHAVLDPGAAGMGVGPGQDQRSALGLDDGLP